MEIYELNPAYFLSRSGLAWQACLKRTGVELELLTDIVIYIKEKKGIKGGRCDSIHRYVKANNKYMKSLW